MDSIIALRGLSEEIIPYCIGRVLNYMLTYDRQIMQAAIKKAQESGLLVAAVPIVPWSGSPRLFLMCQPLMEEIKTGRNNGDEKVRNRFAQLVADISHFVEGGLVNEDLMKQLKPEKYEHWELRSRKPKPSLRVFGRFAMPDVFIGTHVEPRNSLGGMWSTEFEHQKLVCEDHLKSAGIPGNNCFSDPPLFRYETYITENASRKVRLEK